MKNIERKISNFRELPRIWKTFRDPEQEYDKTGKELGEFMPEEVLNGQVHEVKYKRKE